MYINYVKPEFIYIYIIYIIYMYINYAVVILIALQQST